MKIVLFIAAVLLLASAVSHFAARWEKSMLDDKGEAWARETQAGTSGIALLLVIISMFM